LSRRLKRQIFLLEDLLAFLLIDLLFLLQQLLLAQLLGRWGGNPKRCLGRRLAVGGRRPTPSGAARRLSDGVLINRCAWPTRFMSMIGLGWRYRRTRGWQAIRSGGR
jgi:hypothetical protein